MGQEDGLPTQEDLLFDRDGKGPPITVARDQTEGQLGIVFSYLLGVGHQIPQVDDLLGLMPADRGVHTGQRAVRIRED